MAAATLEQMTHPPTCKMASILSESGELFFFSSVLTEENEGKLREGIRDIDKAERAAPAMWTNRRLFARLRSFNHVFSVPRKNIGLIDPVNTHSMRIALLVS